MDKQENISRSRLRSVSRALASVAVALIAGLGMLPFLGSTAFAATAVSGAKISQLPSPATAGLTAVYGIQFTTSSSGSLAAGSGTITIAWPSGSVVPSTASDYTVQVSTGSSVAASTVSVNTAGDAVTITTPSAVPASTLVTVVASGVTNPPAGTYTLVVSTSADTAEVATSNTFAISGSATKVTNVTGPNPTPATTSSSSSVYTIGFTTSSVGALVARTGEVLISAPSGTGLPDTASDYTLNGVAAPSLDTVSSTTGACTVPSATPNVSAATMCVVSPIAVADSTPVSIVINNVTNPSTASSSDTIAISTTSDSSPVSTPDYAIVSPPGAVTGVSVDVATPSTATPSLATIGEAGQSAAYSVSFTTSSNPSGALAADLGQITLTAPSGTSWPSSATAYTVTDTTPTPNTTGTAYNVTVSSSSVVITTPVAIAAGDAVTVDIVGVTNPSTTSAGSSTLPACTIDTTGGCLLDVSTTADTASASGSYTLGTGVTNVSVSINDSAAGVGRSNPPAINSSNATYQPIYTIAFTATTTLASGDFITITAPSGTMWPSSASDYTVNSLAVSSSPGPSVILNYVGFDTPVQIAAGSTATVVVYGVMNPTTASTSDTISVSTSTDIYPVSSSPYTVDPTSVYDVQWSGTGISSTTAASTANYSIAFTTQTALPSGDTITVAAPSGTTFPAYSSSAYSVTVGSSTTDIASGATVSNGGATATITVSSSISVGSVTVAITGVTNPAEGRYTMQVSTQTDTTPAPTPPYKILSTTGSTPSGAVSNVAVPTLSNDWTYSSTYNNLATYSTSFSTSSVGLLTADAGTITITFQSGTVLPGSASAADYVINGVQAYGVTPGATSNIATITTGVNIPASSTVDIVIQGIENPSASTSNTISISTSSDTTPSSSGYYTTVSPPTEVVYDAACTNAAGTQVDIYATPDASGQVATYCVSFETSSSGGLAAGAGTITLQAPAGTTFSSTASDYVINSTSAASAVPSALSGSTTDNQVVLTVNAAIAVSTVVTIYLNGAVTNPPAGAYSMTVFTSSDAYSGAGTSGCTSPTSGATSCDMTLSYDIYNGVSNITGPSPDPAIGQMNMTGYDCPPAPGSPCALYTIGFTVPDATPSGNTIYLGFPQGTTPNTTTSSDYVVNGIISGGVSSCTPLPQGFISTDSCVGITTPASISAASPVTVTVAGVENPEAGTKYAVQIATSVDEAALATSAYALNPAPSVTAAPSLSSYVAGANGVSYTQSFTTSAVGALVEGQGTITLTAPSGTVFSSASTDYTISVNGGSTVNPSKVSGGGTDSATITTPVTVPASTPVTVVASGVTNPGPGTYSLEVSTSSDTTSASAVTAPGVLGTYQIGGAVSNLTGPAPAPGTPQATDSTYTLGFQTSATGALVAQTGTITVTAPSGTIFPTSASDYTVQGVEATTVSGGSDTATITTPVSIGDSTSVSLVISGVTNPTEGQYTLTVKTSADANYATSSTYGIGTSVTSVTGPSPSSSVGGATANYTIGFTTSASGALTGGSGTITLLAPSGTTFPSTVSDYKVNATAASNASVDSSGNQVIIVVPSNIAASTAVTVAVTGVTNPSGGTYTLGVYTSSDFVEVFTPSYTITPPAPTVTAISPTSGPTTGGTSVTITGTNFVTGATVMFGSVTATAVTVGSATSITATSPAEAAGPVNVTVTTPGGTSATSSADQFTYVTPITGDAYTPVNPARLADTRCSASPQPSYCAGENLPSVNSSLTAVAGRGTENITVTGVDSIPISATAVVINVTAVNMTSGGYLSIYPEGSTPAVVSSLDWIKTSGVVTNLVTVPVSNGQITVMNSASTTVNVVVDIEGYYAAPGSTPAGLYNSVTPTRLADSRCAGVTSSYCSALPAANSKVVTLGAKKTDNVTVTGVGPVPSSGVSAVVLNLTAIGPTAGGYLTAFPAGATQAVVSTVNFNKGETVPNRVIVKVGTSGQITIYNNSGSTNFAVDVSGYYTDGSSSSQTGSLFNPVTPARILDTRCAGVTSSYCSALPSANSSLSEIAASKSIAVQVTGEDSIPASATSVVGNLTATGGSGGGYLTAYSGSTVPTTSDVNFGIDTTDANMVISGLTSSGQVNIENGGGTGTVNALFDVSGWFTAATS